MKTEEFRIFFKDGKEGTIEIESKRLRKEDRNEFNVVAVKRGGNILFKNMKGKSLYGKYNPIEITDGENTYHIKVGGNKRLDNFLAWLTADKVILSRTGFKNEYNWSEEVK